jgi:hypothetical protein
MAYIEDTRAWAKIEAELKKDLAYALEQLENADTCDKVKYYQGQTKLLRQLLTLPNYVTKDDMEE